MVSLASANERAASMVRGSGPKSPSSGSNVEEMILRRLLSLISSPTLWTADRISRHAVMLLQLNSMDVVVSKRLKPPGDAPRHRITGLPSCWTDVEEPASVASFFVRELSFFIPKLSFFVAKLDARVASMAPVAWLCRFARSTGDPPMLKEDLFRPPGDHSPEVSRAQPSPARPVPGVCAGVPFSSFATEITWRVEPLECTPLSPWRSRTMSFATEDIGRNTRWCLKMKTVPFTSTPAVVRLRPSPKYRSVCEDGMPYFAIVSSTMADHPRRNFAWLWRVFSTWRKLATTAIPLTISSSRNAWIVMARITIADSSSVSPLNKHILPSDPSSSSSSRYLTSTMLLQARRTVSVLSNDAPNRNGSTP
mmetsp:Transcript_51942/g.123016  ORF Transcript_51942/g.123016 Transcript_51942/m.123016 type:complete len:365 (+) Transcript_51942:518-1612(+)